ncbi:MAG: hypothetical protein M0P49_04480 [Bacilli bacterium]|nr:hypothetical protein [Bacilli bacterium]
MILEKICLFDPTVFTKIDPSLLKEGTINIPYINELVSNKMFFGCLKSSYRDIGGFLTVDLVKASHRILNFEWDGDYIYGDVEILKTPYGDVLTKNIDNVKFAPRLLINFNYCRLITFDATLIKYL